MSLKATSRSAFLLTVLLLFTLFTFSKLRSQLRSNAIADPSVLDIGRVYVGGLYEFQLPAVNATSEPITLTDFRPSCNCITFPVRSVQISPGHGSVPFRVDTTQLSAGDITARANDVDILVAATAKSRRGRHTVVWTIVGEATLGAMYQATSI
jgi:hypothetical protein